VQTYFLEFGLNEVGSDLRTGSCVVYAYRKSINTKP
jgi:hypothetical protein